MTTTRRWICEIALRLALIVSVFCFALYAQDFSDASFCVLAAFWACALFRVLFSFFYEAKQRANAALFRSSGTLIKIFRGRLISGILAFAGAILLSATLSLGLADLRGAELFVTLAALPAALALMRLAVLKLSLKEIKNPRILSLKLSILLLAALAVAVNFAINLAYLRLADGADAAAHSLNSAINFTSSARTAAFAENFATNDASASVGNLATNNAAKSATNSATNNAAIIVRNSETSNAVKSAADAAKNLTASPANFKASSVRVVQVSAANYKANTAAALQINAKNSTASSAAAQNLNLAPTPATPNASADNLAENSATSSASIPEIFEILKSTAPQAHFKSALLNEIYALKFYKNALFDLALSQSPSALKIALLFLICAGDFLFYCAILHLCAFVLFMPRATSAPKIGRFSGTIFALAYVTLCLICAAQTRTAGSGSEGVHPKSAVETGVQIVLQSGERLILSAREADALRGELNATRLAAEANAASALNSYIDAVYDEGARLSAQKMADFNYSFLSDYLVLWHGVWDDDAGAYLNEKFAGFVSESFPKDFGENIAKIAAANVKNYESSLNFTLKKYGAKVDLNVTQSFSLKSKAYRASGTGLGALGAKLISKSLAKTAAKTGAKTLTKAGASATSGSAGLVCGPGAVVCVPAFAVATWFGLDFAFAKGDEALNREEFEAAIVRDMMAEKEELKRALAEDFNATIDEISSEILNLDGK